MYQLPVHAATTDLTVTLTALAGIPSKNNKRITSPDIFTGFHTSARHDGIGMSTPGSRRQSLGSKTSTKFHRPRCLEANRLKLARCQQGHVVLLQLRHQSLGRFSGSTAVKMVLLSAKVQQVVTDSSLFSPRWDSSLAQNSRRLILG